MNDKLEKRPSGALREKGQYLLAFGVVASMLLVAGFPMFVIFFFGIFAYFLFRMFASTSRNETREIFEFYLTANEMLRDDERRWYGFELREAINRGEGILQRMSGAPPLLHFALGALYNKCGDHAAAVKHLSYIVENETAHEAAMVYPSPELRSYVKVLRKIEREPADAPMTSAAVRALERARKLRAIILLEESRTLVPPPAEEKVGDAAAELPPPQPVVDPEERTEPERIAEVEVERPENGDGRRKENKRAKDDPFTNRKPISEVLHDTYDRNVQ